MEGPNDGARDIWTVGIAEGELEGDIDDRVVDGDIEGNSD